MVTTRAELHVLAAHVQMLVSRLLVAESDQQRQEAGHDLQAAGLVCLGEQELTDILTKKERLRFARLLGLHLTEQ